VTVQTSVLLANLGSLDVTLAAAAEVEAAGLGRVWLAETSGPDPLLAAALIAREHDLEVGTAVVPVWSRTPAVLAAAPADIAAIGRRRPFHLGLGAGGQAIVERWHGLDFTGWSSVSPTPSPSCARRWQASGRRTTATGPARRGSG
jgi:alkanesulfonate monooxygenase SsuD/methylene tetrahydromethanopterin reductase-like flavin-dependent oxidoreductase (luciferase family)